MIRTVTVDDFGCFAQKTVAFGPELTLLCGPNGSGKSTIIAAVMWAIFGTKNGYTSIGSEVTVDGTSLRVFRTILHSGEKVTVGDSAATNKRRASESIEAVYGSSETWLRALYITGTNVGWFTSCTLTEKFKYLSRVAGTTEFDAQIAELTKRNRELQRQLVVEKETHRRHQQSLASSQHNFESHQAGFACAGGVSLLAERNQSELTEVLGRIRDIRYKKERQEADLLELENSLTLLEKKRADARANELSCTQCGRPFASSEAKGISMEISSLTQAIAKAEQEIVKHSTTLALYEERVLRLSNEGSQDLQYSQAVSYYENLSYEHLTDIVSNKRSVERSEAAISLLNKESSAVNAACAAVQGHRADTLVNFAKKVAETATAYMQKIGFNRAVEVNVKVEQELLDITVTDPETSTSRPYEKHSSGQRRRIDICLLLAMAECAAALGKLSAESPLVLDEALDTLDREGVQSFTALACEISKHRQVILVSHVDPEIPESPGVHRVNLQGG